MNPHHQTIPQLVKYAPRSLDGMRVIRRQPAAAPVQRPLHIAAKPKAPPQLPQPPTRKPVMAAPPRTAHRLPSALQLPLIVGGAMMLGFLIQSPLIGQILVIIYGIVAFILRISSRITFMLAITALVAAALLMIFKNNIVLAQGYASYTFLLLVAGVIALSREIRKEGGRVYTSRKNVT